MSGANLDALVVNPVDAWIDAIPEDTYAPCACGCGMKWRFAVKDGIEKHEARFMDTHNTKEQVNHGVGMKALGLLWIYNWYGFMLSVVGVKDGFLAVVVDPWDRVGRSCKTVYATQDEARRRCWGMVRQSCELKAAQAAERMADNGSEELKGGRHEGDIVDEVDGL